MIQKHPCHNTGTYSAWIECHVVVSSSGVLFELPPLLWPSLACGMLWFEGTHPLSLLSYPLLDSLPVGKKLGVPVGCHEYQTP